MTLRARLASAVVAAALLAAWHSPVLACSCDKEARIKKYGTLRLGQEAKPPAPAVPVVVPPPASPSS